MDPEELHLSLSPSPQGRNGERGMRLLLLPESYPPSEITEWIDGGMTATCPRCGINSVLPDAPDTDTLAMMHRRWFAEAQEPQGDA